MRQAFASVTWSTTSPDVPLTRAIASTCWCAISSLPRDPVVHRNVPSPVNDLHSRVCHRFGEQLQSSHVAARAIRMKMCAMQSLAHSRMVPVSDSGVAWREGGADREMETTEAKNGSH